MGLETLPETGFGIRIGCLSVEHMGMRRVVTDNVPSNTSTAKTYKSGTSFTAY